MPSESNNPLYSFQVNRICQISEAHCGPAVIQMLLGHLGIFVTQEEVAEAGEVTDRIEIHGMRVDQLGRAVQRLAPTTQFWYKKNAKLEELIELITLHKFPVGVEWQGVFSTDEDEDEDEDEESDYGHYSVIPHIDLERKELIIVDPYKDFVSQDRIFSIDAFVERWWDTNETVDPRTGKEKLVEDYHMMFIIAPKEATFPQKLKMKRG